MNTKTFKSFVENDGVLVPIEFGDLPFVPQRAFYVTNVPKDDVRGKHAHHLGQQYLVCIKGRVQVILDYGNVQKYRTLHPNEGILVDKMVWDSQKFLTGNDILLVFASLPYDKNDYIEDYEEFKSLVK